MKDRLNLPAELQALIEKRENEERRQNSEDMRQKDSDSPSPESPLPIERRSGMDRRHGEE